MGLFAKEGLDVDLKADGGESESIGRVMAGLDVIGLVRADAFLLARSDGAPIVAFAGGYLETPVAFYAAERSDTGARGAFLGKRIGYRAGDDTAFIYEGLMDRLQISRNLVHEVQTTSDPSGLTNGDLDIWPGHIGEHANVSCRSNLGCAVLRPADYGLHAVGSVYFVTEKTLHENPRALLGFLRAIIAGWGMAYSDDSAALATMPALLPAERGHVLSVSLAQQLPLLQPPNDRFAEFDIEAWRGLADILINAKILPHPVDLSRAVTFDILSEAYRKPISSAR
jgi:NitT/TauT family transport system substrate-binding protein